MGETAYVQEWFIDAFGDPCRQCGYVWSSATLDSALEQLAGGPARYSSLLAGTDGSQRHPALKWSAKAYVFHVADNLRIWTERLAGALAGASRTVAPYDDNLLADARNYEEMPIQAALWSLTKAVEDWGHVVTRARDADVQLSHPERGTLTVREVAVSNVHDAVHHEWDITRINEAGQTVRGAPAAKPHGCSATLAPRPRR